MAPGNHYQGLGGPSTMYHILCNTTDNLIHRTSSHDEVRNFLTREGRNAKAYAVYNREPELCNGVRGDHWLGLRKPEMTPAHPCNGLIEIVAESKQLAERIAKWHKTNPEAEYLLRRQTEMLMLDLQQYALCVHPAKQIWEHRTDKTTDTIPF
jgi:hypothetical protein